MSYGNKPVTRRFVRIAALLALIVAGPIVVLQTAPGVADRTIAKPVAVDVAAVASARSTAKAVYFHTLPPGAKLPSGAACARLVRASPHPEDKAVNTPYNNRPGRRVSARFLAFDGPKAQHLGRRVNGDFTGTTIDILRWAACKWGINQDIVFAQAAVESWWRQNTLGDWGTEPSMCRAGHKLGHDGQPGECPQSYGILQVRYPYEPGGWPAIARSTAMDADAAYAVWRACYDGYETWLNTVPRGSQYHKGSVWGCVGRWAAGSWFTPAAHGYIAKVKQYLREKIWRTPDFQEGH